MLVRLNVCFFSIFLFSVSQYSFSHSGGSYHSGNHAGDDETAFCSSKGFAHDANGTGAGNDNFYGYFRSSAAPWTAAEAENCNTSPPGHPSAYCQLFTGVTSKRWGGGSSIICMERYNGCPLGYLGREPNCISTSSGEGGNIGSSPHNTCKPINISTGNKFFQFIDYQDQDFLFSYSYNSVTGAWRFSYQQKLMINSGHFVVAERMDGKGIHFTNNNGDYVSSTQTREQLSFDGSVYTLTFPDNSVETYDASGRLLSVEPYNKEPVLISYTQGQITVSKNNESIVLALDAVGQVVQANFPDSTTANYTYIDNGGVSVLSTVIFSGNTTRQYLYEDTRFPTYITGIVDENNNRISSVQYDAQGRAISSEAGPLNSGIERTQIAYNADGTRTVTNALGKQSTYHFTQFNGEYKMTQVEGHASANCAGANKAYTYDANGFLASKTDWKNNLTTYVHNDRGQELSRTEASGTPQARTITTEWHTTFNLPVRIIEPERETVMTYDTNGRLQSRETRVRSGS